MRIEQTEAHRGVRSLRSAGLSGGVNQERLHLRGARIATAAVAPVLLDEQRHAARDSSCRRGRSASVRGHVVAGGAEREDVFTARDEVRLDPSVIGGAVARGRKRYDVGGRKTGRQVLYSAD